MKSLMIKEILDFLSQNQIEFNFSGDSSVPISGFSSLGKY